MRYCTTVVKDNGDGNTIDTCGIATTFFLDIAQQNDEINDRKQNTINDQHLTGKLVYTVNAQRQDPQKEKDSNTDDGELPKIPAKALPGGEEHQQEVEGQVKVEKSLIIMKMKHPYQHKPPYIH